MTIILLANVGNSDLRVSGNERAPFPPRPAGRELWETYEQHTFALPIIEPCLDHLKGKVAQIDRVILFDTDQQPTEASLAKDRYGVALRDKDTLWFGRIVQRYLEEHYADMLGTVERVTIKDINPSLYDDALKEYKAQLRSLDDGTVEQCYILTAGGTQAFNNALQLQAISRFRTRCRALYKPENSDVYDLGVGQQVLATFKEATAIEFIQRYDFAGAMQLMADDLHASLYKTLEYAHYRLAFDFARAQQTLEQAIDDSGGKVRYFLRSLRPSLSNLIDQQDLNALLAELYINAKITYQHGRYADFLGRLFRFQEAVLRYMVEQIYGLSTDYSKAMKAAHQAAFLEHIDTNVQLRTFLDEYQLGGQLLKYRDDLSVPVLLALVQYATDPQKGQRADGTPYLPKNDRNLYHSALAVINKFNSLAQLRHQSIIAHGFQGISEHAIAEAYKGDVLSDMHSLLKRLGIQPDMAIYDTISNFLIQRLGRRVD